MSQNTVKQIRVNHPIAGINNFSCACKGTLSVAIDLDTYAAIKTHGSRTFTPICPECRKRTVVHIG